MLIPRQTLAFDFKGAHFDLESAQDRKFLAWVFDQFLYGEVTGIQCGHWLFHAPHLNAATFLSKQAGEELSHVRKILRIFSILGEKPSPAHPAIRFMSTGMMGGSWGEHVTLEMALGEGLVLTAFYALADTLQHPELKRILESAITEEERHVTFGENETFKWLKSHPSERKLLLGLALFQVMALQKLKNFISRKLLSTGMAEHLVLSKFPEFYDHTIRQLEIRIEMLGLDSEKVLQSSSWSRWTLIASVPFRMFLGKLRRWSIDRPKLLTQTYLEDPTVLSEFTPVGPADRRPEEFGN
ncbi:MAG: ferritin-like domain-containing protein [Methylotenera sp.]|nr:ferritin-like domain-containing protein [Oligoflexia bacterium]